LPKEEEEDLEDLPKKNLEDLPKHIVGQNWEELPNSKDPDEAWKEYKK